MPNNIVKPKLLFIIDNLSTGGAQRQMVNLAVGLKKRGYNIEFFCYAQGDLLAKPIIDAGIQVHRNLKSRRFSLDILTKLRKIINNHHYDLILSFLTTPNFYAILMGRVLRLKRIPVIVSERFCDLPQGVSLTEKFSRQLYRFACHVVTNSNHQRKNLMGKYPWLKDKISTIYNGYDLNYFVPAGVEQDHQTLKILTIASVSPYKNGLCLVESLNILRKRTGFCPQVDWIGQLVMKGDRLEYLNRMKKSISDYGLEDHWHWLNQRSDIVDQLHQHDVLVHPSYGEGLPNVVCEALACATPVIVSDTLDHSQLVQNTISGYLFDYRNPSDLAEKIQMFNGLNPDERRKMGSSGRAYAEAQLSIDKLVDNYEKIFLQYML